MLVNEEAHVVNAVVVAGSSFWLNIVESVQHLLTKQVPPVLWANTVAVTAISLSLRAALFADDGSACTAQTWGVGSQTWYS